MIPNSRIHPFRYDRYRRLTGLAGLLTWAFLSIVTVSVTPRICAAACHSGTCAGGSCSDASCESGCAGACRSHSCKSKGGDGCSRCPRCHIKCELKVETVDEDKHCWKIESKEICVPRFVFPWQKTCDPCADNGSWVRTVCVMKKHKYKCPSCKYSWSKEEDEDGDEEACTDSTCKSCTDLSYPSDDASTPEEFEIHDDVKSEDPSPEPADSKDAEESKSGSTIPAVIESPSGVEATKDLVPLPPVSQKSPTARRRGVAHSSQQVPR